MEFPMFLKVVLMSKLETIRINETTEVQENVFDSIAVKFTETLSQTLRFSYELVPPPNGEFGKSLPNGNWTGMVGMVQHSGGEVISVLAVSEERSEVIDFSYPIQREKVTFATRKPEYKPDPKSFLWPFTFEVWLSIVACYAVMPVLFYVLLRQKHSFRKLVFTTHRTFLTQGMDISPMYAREYFLLAFWIVGAMFTVYSYTAVLLSFLTFPTLEGVRTIPELAAAVADGQYQCTCYPGSYIVKSLLMSPDLNSRIIGSNLERNEGSRDIDGVLKNSRPHKTAFLSTGDYFLPYKTKYHISEDEFFPALRSVAFSKNFCCQARLDSVISYIWVSGIYQKWVADAAFVESLKIINQSPNFETTRRKWRKLSVKDVEGAFLLLCFGYLLATSAFLYELISGYSRFLTNSFFFRFVWSKPERTKCLPNRLNAFHKKMNKTAMSKNI